MVDRTKMSLVQKNKLEEYLKVELKYNEKEVMQAITAVMNMDVQLRTKLMEYIATRRIPDIAAEGISVMDLIERLEMNPVTAFISMDYLITNPEEAKYILTRREEKIEIDEDVIKKLKSKNNLVN